MNAPRQHASPIRVTFCWTRISGYMTACWRALANHASIDPFVVAFRPHPDDPAPFDKQLMQDVPCQLLDEQQRADPATIESIVRAQQPDVIVVAGWGHKAYRQLLRRWRATSTPIVLAMDTPWRGDFRQQGARRWLRPTLKRIDQVVVPGERAWQYAKRLGVPEQRIKRGLYGIDYDAMQSSVAARRAQPATAPARLLFVGRYAPVKGLDVLLDAFARYRAAQDAPFTLTCCGSGPLRDVVKQAPDVTDRGFVQPQDLPDVFAEHDALILPSRYDPWPLVLVEACAAGLPVICTEACGSAVELVRPMHNGLIVPTEDVPALTQALHWAHAHRDDLATMGARGGALASAYSAQRWAQRWETWLREAATSRATTRPTDEAAKPCEAESAATSLMRSPPAPLPRRQAETRPPRAP